MTLKVLHSRWVCNMWKPNTLQPRIIYTASIRNLYFYNNLFFFFNNYFCLIALLVLVLEWARSLDLSLSLYISLCLFLSLSLSPDANEKERPLLPWWCETAFGVMHSHAPTLSFTGSAHYTFTTLQLTFAIFTFNLHHYDMYSISVNLIAL